MVTFKQKVDKSQIPVCNILGVNVTAIDMEWLLDFTDRHIKKLSGDYMCVSNVHTTVISYEDKTYCNVHKGGIMAIPDGGPLSTGGRKRGFKNMKCTTGHSYMGEIFSISVSEGLLPFSYGSTEETHEKLNMMLRHDYPGIQIAGMYSLPFRPSTEEENHLVIERINETKPDFVWVGLGAPEQERWMVEYQGKIKGFTVGVEVGFDYFAGNISRAPEWRQKINLE